MRRWGGGVRLRVTCALITCVMTVQTPAMAAEATAPRHGTTALEQRVRELEKQNAELLRRLDRLERAQGDAPETAAVSTGAARREHVAVTTADHAPVAATAAAPADAAATASVAMHGEPPAE